MQVAYTTGYGAVMPAYSQPMMSAGQMPHDDVTNQQPLNGHSDTVGEEYVTGVDTDYTGANDSVYAGGTDSGYTGGIQTDYNGVGDYFTAETFVPVSDTVKSASPVDECLNDETSPADRLVSHR